MATPHELEAIRQRMDALYINIEAEDALEQWQRDKAALWAHIERLEAQLDTKPIIDTCTTS